MWLDNFSAKSKFKLENLFRIVLYTDCYLLGQRNRISSGNLLKWIVMYHGRSSSRFVNSYNTPKITYFEIISITYEKKLWECRCFKTYRLESATLAEAHSNQTKLRLLVHHLIRTYWNASSPSEPIKMNVNLELELKIVIVDNYFVCNQW